MLHLDLLETRQELLSVERRVVHDKSFACYPSGAMLCIRVSPIMNEGTLLSRRHCDSAD